jgi:hypothetical protein
MDVFFLLLNIAPVLWFCVEQEENFHTREAHKHTLQSENNFITIVYNKIRNKYI